MNLVATKYTSTPIGVRFGLAEVHQDQANDEIEFSAVKRIRPTLAK
jgi:hypothetical protein